MATGPGPKRQECGTVPGCEVAGWGLTQALVGDLHCEESQPPRLIWNLPKPGSRAKGLCLPISWSHLKPPPTWLQPPPVPLSLFPLPHYSWGVSLPAMLCDLHTCRPGSGMVCQKRRVHSLATVAVSLVAPSATQRPLSPSLQSPTGQG